MAQAFALPQGQAGSATTSDGKSGVVFRVKEIKPAPAPGKEQTDKLTSELAQSLQQDLWATFVGTLEGQAERERQHQGIPPRHGCCERSAVRRLS